MSKVSLSSISSGYQSTTQLNNNLNTIISAFENTISRDGSTPNTMSADFDMNGFSLLNVGSIGVVGGLDLSTLVTQASDFATESEHWAIYPHATLVPEGNLIDEYSSYSYSIDSASSALSAASSASLAASSEAACVIYSTLGLSASNLYDFGLIADTIIVFPTDFGTIV
jgi:hypothetical protein